MTNQVIYSIVYVSPDSRLGDKVAIGMLLLDGAHLIFKYSLQKLHNLKSVLGDYWDPVSKSLRATQKYIENIDITKKPIFQEAREMVSKDYLTKLSIYANGLIQFQEPKTAILTSTFGVDQFYLSLFPEDHKTIEKSAKPNYRNLIDQSFVSKIEQQVHVKIDIDDKIIPDFYINYSLDAIGRNGEIYIAKYIDFSVEQKAPISHLIVTTEELSRIFNNNKFSNVFIFGVEPEIGSELHKKWAFVNKYKGYKMFHPDQAEEVANIFLNSGATKFIKV